jgi:hypothetical protein
VYILQYRGLVLTPNPNIYMLAHLGNPPCAKQMTICVGEKIALDLIILSFFILGSVTQ